MNEADKGKICLGALLFTPLVSWFIAAKSLYGFTPENARERLILLIQQTFDLWPLWGALLAGEVISIIGLVMFFKYNHQVFKGAPFKKIYRGTQLVSQKALASLTKEKEPQITIADIPVPTSAETTHISIAGATGVGKSTIFAEMMKCCLLRAKYERIASKKDRMIILDPDGDFLSRFYKKGDKILNCNDARTEGWVFFNEIKNDFDFERFGVSIVPTAKDSQTEEWNGYGRLLFTEVARKVFNTSRNPTMDEVFYWTNEVPLEELEAYVNGTKAQALFAGSSRAVGSARFVLSNKLAPHLKMPTGNFSIREWLGDPKGGNLYITWTDEMRESLKSLISCWTDSIFSIVLGMPKSKSRRIWTYIDELESLDYLPSLRDALTKGRKKGLRIVSGYQSYSQVISIYGREVAETLLSNHRTSVVMAAGRLGERTLDFVSKSLGEIEGEREKSGTSRRFGQLGTKSTNDDHKRERAVTPTEIATLDDLTGYIAFPGNLPVAKFETHYVNYTRTTPVPGVILRENTAFSGM
ncbi:type IV secretion system DNA-binding domain-containing protein [Lonsdalea quercina]|uniref:type IV secretion system DNA-binding domain-containing protein n=1 Tax=Lonsdalea quercina TaxID=71657 RepID=UPI0039757833